MKLKQILLFALCITFFACSTESTDSNDDNNTDDTLLKKMVETYDGETFTTNFTYNGKKLINIKDSDGYETKIIYTKNKITKVKNLVDGEVAEYFDLFYNDDKVLASYIHYLYDIDDENIASKDIVTYNKDNTIENGSFHWRFHITN